MSAADRLKWLAKHYGNKSDAYLLNNVAALVEACEDESGDEIDYCNRIAAALAKLQESQCGE